MLELTLASPFALHGSLRPMGVKKRAENTGDEAIDGFYLPPAFFPVTFEVRSLH